MPISTRDGQPVWRHRTTRASLALWAGWLGLVALTVYCWQVMTEGTIWAFVLDAPRQAQDLGGRMLPPRWSYLGELLWPMWDTLNIATLGTLMGVGMAVPVAFLAARNTTPSLLIARPIALFIIVATRSINSLIWALLLVSIIGPGVLAGIVAIGLRSIGFVAKLLYEAIEEIDEAQVEAISATGGSPAQVVNYAIVPQVLPAFAGISVFRWDINIRESTILGLVGAGGIGL
ncbi:MAG TPA: phosphonate ABC transporter, permease protein PhnE, partial [Thermohalobaculum sp.]|nr:phosphonate ABC transporter, permease protein PhnE [Thermohalobaculum sp.]